MKYDCIDFETNYDTIKISTSVSRPMSMLLVFPVSRPRSRLREYFKINKNEDIG